jgi:oligopeptide transport system substrate-binding protein
MISYTKSRSPPSPWRAAHVLYETAHNLPDGAQRTAIFDQMNDMIFNYAPWILTNYPYQNVLVQPWVKGYKQNALTLQQWRYYDVEPRP